MPILVQWKWQENTKSFLVIFHFYDDFSKTNLRCNLERIVNRNIISVQKGVNFKYAIDKLISPSKYDHFDTATPKPVVTWAPSHPELGYLAEILRYANIIDGFDETKKQDIRPFLASESRFQDKIDQKYAKDFTANKELEKLSDILFDKRELFCIEKENDEVDLVFRGIELCPEYVDYLREIVKIFLKP